MNKKIEKAACILQGICIFGLFILASASDSNAISIKLTIACGGVLTLLMLLAMACASHCKKISAQKRKSSKIIYFPAQIFDDAM